MPGATWSNSAWTSDSASAGLTDPASNEPAGQGETSRPPALHHRRGALPGLLKRPGKMAFEQPAGDCEQRQRQRYHGDTGQRIAQPGAGRQAAQPRLAQMVRAAPAIDHRKPVAPAPLPTRLLPKLIERLGHLALQPPRPPALP